MKHTKFKCLWRTSLLEYSNDKNNLKFRSHLRDYLPEVYYLCEFSVHFLEVPAFILLCKCYTIATYSFAYIYYRLRFTCGLFLSVIGWHHLIFYILCLFSYKFWDLIFSELHIISFYLCTNLYCLLICWWVKTLVPFLCYSE